MQLLSEYRFLADENIDPELINYLQKQGFDIISVNEINLSNTSDKIIFEKAFNDKRVILTHDADFGMIAFTQQQLFIGIIYLRPGHLEGKRHIETFEAILGQQFHLIKPFMIIAENQLNKVKIRLRNAIEV